MESVCAATFEVPEPRAAASCVETRRQQRVMYCQQAWALPITAPTEYHSIIVHDISTIGVGFVSAHDFAPGSWLLLTFPFPNGAWRKVLCFTRRCQGLDNGLFHTGAQFEAALAIEGPSNTVPEAWLEWVLDQQEKQARPLGGPVLEPELIALCGNTEAEYY
jgi:hypothetical protein